MKEESSSWFFTNEQNRSPTVLQYRGASVLRGSVLTGLKLFVKPLVNAVSNYIGCDGQNEGKECLHRFFTPFPNLMESEGRHLQDTIKFDETQEKPLYSYKTAQRLSIYKV